MIVQKILDLSVVTSDFYSCNLTKGEELTLDFGNAKLVFPRCLLFKCGYPNEEIYLHYDYYTSSEMHKHNLCEVEDSAWVKELNDMNSVHRRHNDRLFENYRHFIILFEDEVFECVSTSYQLHRDTPAL